MIPYYQGYQQGGEEEGPVRDSHIGSVDSSPGQPPPQQQQQQEEEEEHQQQDALMMPPSPPVRLPPGPTTPSRDIEAFNR